MVINSNITKNATLFYCDLNIADDCFLIFFGLLFEVNIDNFLKKKVLNVIINMLLKCIGSDITIIFIIYDDFQSS